MERSVEARTPSQRLIVEQALAPAEESEQAAAAAAAAAADGQALVRREQVAIGTGRESLRRAPAAAPQGRR